MIMLLNELLLRGQSILLILEGQLTKEKVEMDIIPMQVSNLGFKIREYPLRLKKKMDKRSLPKIFDETSIAAKKLIVPKTLSKLSKNLGHFL